MTPRRRLDDSDGFTLVELLVVVIIIGILASIAIPTFLSQRQQASRATLTADLRNIAVLAEAHYYQHDGYAGFETSAAYTGYTGSPGVVRSATSTALSYCVQASRDGVVMRVRTNPGNTPSITTAAC